MNAPPSSAPPMLHADGEDEHGYVEIDEDVNSRLRRRMRRASILLLAMLILLIAVATVVRIDGAVVATGSISVESRVKSISHPTGGVLAKVNVRDGDKVQEGDVIMEFETNVSGANSQFSNQSMDQLLARQARLEAERAGNGTMRIPAGVNDSSAPSTRNAIAQERRLLKLRRQERNGNISLLNDRIRQLQQLIKSYQAQIEAAEAQIKLIGPELDGLRKLYERQLVTINRLNQLERQAVDLRGNIGALNANIAQTRARISETREQIRNVDQSIRADAATELAQVTAAISNQRIRIAEADDRFEKSTVRAPTSGYVDKLTFNTVGSLVPSGALIAQIVPDADKLVVTGLVSPADIDQLRQGQDARVMFSTMNQNVTPELTGKLTFISAEVSDDGNGGPSFFRVRVELDKNSVSTGLYNQLRAGTPADIFLQTGDRSLLSYLFKPLLDQMNFAFRQ